MRLAKVCETNLIRLSSARPHSTICLESNNVIIDYTQLANIKDWNRDKKIVLGGGTFDLIHYGHVQYLQKLAEYGETVVVAIKSDAEIAQEKGIYRPIIPEADRLRMVDAIVGVDYSFIVPEYSFVTAIKEHRPDFFMTCNPRWKRLKNLSLTKVIIEPRFTGGYYKSTTSIIKHITATHS